MSYSDPSSKPRWWQYPVLPLSSLCFYPMNTLFRHRLSVKNPCFFMMLKTIPLIEGVLLKLQYLSSLIIVLHGMFCNMPRNSWTFLWLVWILKFLLENILNFNLTNEIKKNSKNEKLLIAALITLVFILFFKVLLFFLIQFVFNCFLVSNICNQCYNLYLVWS